jgi:hypothetical protein
LGRFEWWDLEWTAPLADAPSVRNVRFQGSEVRATLSCTTEPSFGYPKTNNEHELIFLPNASCRSSAGGAYELTMRLDRRLPGNGGFSEVLCGQAMLLFNEARLVFPWAPKRRIYNPQTVLGLGAIRDHDRTSLKLVTIQLAVCRGIPAKGSTGAGYR